MLNYTGEFWNSSMSKNLEVSESEYRSRPLVFLTIIRPNIAYAILVVSQFVAHSTLVHGAVVLRMFIGPQFFGF